MLPMLPPYLNLTLREADERHLDVGRQRAADKKTALKQRFLREGSF